VLFLPLAEVELERLLTWNECTCSVLILHAWVQTAVSHFDMHRVKANECLKVGTLEVQPECAFVIIFRLV